MKKLFPVLLLMAVATGAASAQRRSTVNGVVADADTRQGLIGVVIELMPASDSTQATVIVSGAGGAFSTGLGRQQQYIVRASMLGYETLRRTVDVAGARQALDTLFISQGIHLDAVVKEAVRMRTSVSGDTLLYNADSFRVAADADVASLLQKMPGITVSGSTVEAQGETIRKVLLDGKEYFGEDVGAAISSIPAEAIKGVELFDKLSDNAEFTGIDDGESYKTLNLVTRESMRTMITGKINGLYGVEPPKHEADGWHHFGMTGGSVNILRGDQRLTVGGNLNNINERSFTFNDPLGVGDDDIARVGRFQISYRNLLGKNKKWDVNGTYSFNITDAESDSSVDRIYYESDDPASPVPWSGYRSETERTNLNRGHNFNSRIDFRPNQNHRLMIRAGASYQGNRTASSSLGTYTPSDGGDNIVLDNWSRSTGNNFSSNLTALYSVRLGKAGRTLMVSANGSYSPRDGDSESYTERPDRPTRWQSVPSDNLSYNIGGGVVYTEPLGEKSLIALDYGVSYSYSDNDRKSYLWDETLGGFDWSAPDPSLSGIYTNRRTTHRIGPRYSITRNETTFVAGVGYQYMVSEVDRVLPRPLDIKADFHNVTYNVMVRSKLAEGHNLRADIRSRMGNPSVFDLEDIPDISNPQNISRGNPDLKSSYTNSLSVNYNISMIETGRTLSFSLGGSQTSNSIVRRVLINSEGFLIHDSDGAVIDTLDAVGRYAEPVNLNGAWNARFGAAFGFPVKFLRSNVNLSAGVSYSERPSQIGTWTPAMTAGPQYTTNYLNSISPSGSIYIGSNVSENVDFGVNYRLSYNNERSTFSTGGDNETLNHYLRVNYKFVLPLYFTFSGSANYRFDKQLTREGRDNEFFMLNLSVGKKVLRSRLAEVNLFVNNLFDRNDSFRRTYADDYFQSTTRSTIGRYFGVSFTWNIRNFKGGGPSPATEGGGRGERGGWNGPGGGRGPGGPPAVAPPMGGGGRGGFGGGRGF